MASVSLNIPRRLGRLPRVGRTQNPFKAGTSKAGTRIRRALAAHSALLAANNIPGKAFAAGALGAKLAGPPGAAAAFGAVEAASIAGSALLARAISRRGKLAGYLARRGKRKSGVYKSLWSFMFRGKKTKARYIKPRPNTKAGGKDDFQPVRFVRRIGAGGLPIGESRPFRNSWRGSSRDLYNAARGIFKTRGFSPMSHNMTKTVLGDLGDAIEKARGLLPAGTPQAYYTMRRAYNSSGNRRKAANLRPGPAGKFSRVARLSRASNYLMRRGNRNTSHSWGFGRRPDGSIAKAVAALELIEKAGK